jgi:hypothetical protein
MKTVKHWRKIEQNARKWESFTCSLTDRINIVKMAILLKVIPMLFFKEIKKINPKIQIEEQKTQYSQSNCVPKKQCWRYHST